MAELGTDLWSADAVVAVKREVGRQVGEELAKVVSESVNEKITAKQEGAATAEASGSNGKVTEDSETEPPTAAVAEGEQEKAEKEDKETDEPTEQEAPHINGTTAPPPQPPARLPTLQIVFDAIYLRQILSVADEDHRLHAVETQGLATAKSAGELDSSADERLRKNAKESWKRSFLLFGLLAG
jgi:hypothetical protein